VLSSLLSLKQKEKVIKRKKYTIKELLDHESSEDDEYGPMKTTKF